TRSDRDWSSDVCSSDLFFGDRGGAAAWRDAFGFSRGWRAMRRTPRDGKPSPRTPDLTSEQRLAEIRREAEQRGEVKAAGVRPSRSEERRVGKECRARRS